MSELNPGIVFLSLVVLAFSLSVHELAHAWTALRFGDDTAALQGRVTLNPAAHVDLVGTIIFPLVALVSGIPLLGWAKPVPVDPRKLRHPRRHLILIAIAGPASNLLLALLVSIVWQLVPGVPSGRPNPASLWAVGQQAFFLNVALAVFNLLPIPPLDGGNVLGNLLPPRQGYAFDQFMRPYGFLILYALMFTGALWTILGPPMLFLANLLWL